MSQQQGDSASLVPQPLPEQLWGKRWQFGRLTADDLEFRLLMSPIPIREVSANARPSEQSIPPSALIPGVVIEAGLQSMKLARWISAQTPLGLVALNRELGALMLDTESHRWIVATYQDEEVRSAADQFERLKSDRTQIHFLLVQPDDTGITHSGLWIFRP